MSDEKDLEKAILEYLESRDDDWAWGTSTKTYTKKETIRLFRKDKRFRKFIMTEALKTTINGFLRSAKIK